jgi:hypothetical protein
MRPNPLACTVIAVAALSAFSCSSSDSNGLDTPVPSGGTSCTSNTDCKSPTAVCDILAERCVQCLFDTQCDDGDVCLSRTCVTPTPCSTSLDCVDAGATSICDPGAKQCVQCVTADDCTGTADCIGNECMPYDDCTTSLDCPTGEVCDQAAERCVECVTADDCSDGNVCVGNVCEVRTECQSDNQCTPEGKLCDKALGYCVSCLTNVQCPDGYHCELGACALDACEAGATKCQGNAVVACDATGQSWGSPQPCPPSTSCTSSAGVASCGSTVCTAGATYCQGDELITCSADGMTITSTVNCAAQDKHCSGGKCTDQACVPNSMYCEGNELRQCNGAGTASLLVQTCTAQQTCDPSTGSCVSLACAPGAAVCNGSVATTCNAAGTGYVAGGTDCALQNKSCEAGVCVDCGPSGGPPTEVRMTEVFMGNVDYIVLKNRGTCGAQLDGLSLRISSTTPDTLDFDLPSYVLDPGANVYLIYSTGVQAGDLAVPGIEGYLLPSLGEWVALCQGPCTGGVILDYFVHADGGTPPAGPPGVTFEPGPVSGIDTFTAATNAYLRVAYAGTSPSFSAADWQISAATRP